MVRSRGSDQAFAGTRRSNSDTRAEPLAASSIRGLNSRWSAVNGIRYTLDHYFMSRNRKIAVIDFYYVRLLKDAAFARAGGPVSRRGK